ncbi:Uncharacterised protein [Vibrio cholerae]|nr:Uncharacterised protein [Vibrio cholerae]
MRSKALRTLFVLWNSKTTAVCMIGFLITSRFHAIHASMNSAA